MALIVNSCRGAYASNEVEISTADIAKLTALMEGVVDVYDEKGTAGTETSVTPPKMNRIKLGVNRKEDRLGCTVTLKHMKSTKNEDDLFGAMALFNADFKSDLKATGLRVIYQGEL